jgi:glyoxylase-like metal-dependent hydrolase (beta-lactamase superfamily II)
MGAATGWHPQTPAVDAIVCRVDGPGGPVKAFLVHAGSSLVLIDTGFDERDGRRIVEHIRARAADRITFAAVVLTHSHIDHIGGLGVIVEEFGWPVIAHRDELPALESAGVRVDRTVRDGETWPAAGGLTFAHLPGHTAGSLAVWHPATRTLIAGDALVSAGRHLMVSPPFLSDEPEIARASVAGLLDRGWDIDAVLVAHGEDVPTGAATPLGRVLLNQRYNTVSSA